MSKFKCPYCGNGEMVLQIIPRHRTKMGGVPVEVSDAHISKCNSCGETSVSAKELKRWEQFQREQLRSLGDIPSPKDVKRIRESLGLSVSDFAKLLGVTRQTIYAWEREDVAALQLSPASLLLGVLGEESVGNLKSVLRYLVEKAALRNQQIEVESTPEEQDCLVMQRATKPIATGAPRFYDEEVMASAI